MGDFGDNGNGKKHMTVEIKDITEEVEFEHDGGDYYLPIIKCKCGYKSYDSFSFRIDNYGEDFDECPMCGIKMIFKTVIKVYEVKENSNG